MSDIKSVAVIGAGISGVCSAAHLLNFGLDVVVFERSSISGGVWHFDPNSAHEPQYPNEIPSVGDYQRHVFDDDEAYQTPPHTPKRDQSPQAVDEDTLYYLIAHAPPGPCYSGLRNNVSLTAMTTSLGRFPVGLEEFVSQQYLEEYIQTIAEVHGVNSITQFGTRVESVRKVGQRWRVCTTTFGTSNSSSISRTISYFDAVVVASGHYHMPRIPDIPGLKTLKDNFPTKVMHSKGYRNAEPFRNAKVLIIGAGVSSIDIAKEIHEAGGSVYQSSRGGLFDLPATSLPESAHRVAGVAEFVITASSSDQSGQIPVSVKLVDGSVLDGFHRLILATGYITSYPFLPDKHADQKSKKEADAEVIVTKEGDMNHNLFKDIFYIEDPSLAFIGVPYHISTFSLYDHQAQAMARIFAGKSTLPDKASMRIEYKAKVTSKGLGREFHSLRKTGAEMEYVQELVDLINEKATCDTFPMTGHTREWLAAHRLQRVQLAERFAGKIEDWVPRSLLLPSELPVA